MLVITTSQLRDFRDALSKLLTTTIFLTLVTFPITTQAQDSWIPTFISDAMKSDLELSGPYRAHLDPSVYVDLEFEGNNAYFTIGRVTVGEDNELALGKDGFVVGFSERGESLYLDDVLVDLNMGRLGKIKSDFTQLQFDKKFGGGQVLFYPLLEMPATGTYRFIGEQEIGLSEEKLIRDIERKEELAYVDFQTQEILSVDEEKRFTVVEKIEDGAWSNEFNYWISPPEHTPNIILVRFFGDTTYNFLLRPETPDLRIRLESDGYPLISFARYEEILEEERQEREKAEKEAEKKRLEELRQKRIREEAERKRKLEIERQALEAQKARERAEKLAQEALEKEKARLLRERLEQRVYGFQCAPYAIDRSSIFGSEEATLDYTVDLARSTVDISGIDLPGNSDSNLASALEAVNPFHILEIDGSTILASTSLYGMAALAPKVTDDQVDAFKEISLNLNISQSKPELIKLSVAASETAIANKKERVYRDIFKSFGRPNKNGLIASDSLKCRVAGDGYQLRERFGAEGEDYLPIFKVAPIYPRRAQTRGVTGSCVVEYTVNQQGRVIDPKAVDCYPMGMFESSSIKAAQKFRYIPRIVDGKRVSTPGVRNMFKYDLERGRR